MQNIDYLRGRGTCHGQFDRPILQPSICKTFFIVCGRSMAQSSEGIYKNNTFQLGYGRSCLLSAEWFVSIFFLT